MKTVGRVLIILAVFAVVMGVTYLIVNSRNSSTPGPARFEEGNQRFAPPDGAPNSERPEFPGGGRNAFRGERRGDGWLSGAIKNIAIIGMIVVLIVVPKAWLQKRKKTAQVAAG